MPSLYRLFTNLAAPLIALYLFLRKRKGREDSVRFKERLGIASAARPKGKLVWCHGASVGEAMSVLALIRKLRLRHPDWNLLVTTGTVTSAQLLATRLPDNVIHQYMPVDRWPYVTRFLSHWKPDLALWVESEIWPNMLSSLSERKIPAILLNGRMSEKSYARWRMVPCGARKLMASFALGLAQTGGDRNRLAALGLKDVRAIGNLKYAADPLPHDEGELSSLRQAVGSRKLWIMASTHPGEEEIALAIHNKLRLRYPDLLTIIIPRHPARGQEIAEMIEKAGGLCTRRSLGSSLTTATQIYLADTMGELGLFYRLSAVCCLAGSFTWGGHNPVEPAQLGCAILFGPRMDNFAIMADDILSAGAAIQVADTAELEQRLAQLLTLPEEATALADKARSWAAAKQGVLEETLTLLDPFFTQSKSDRHTS